MNEKRNYHKNGLGRRDYDKMPCPFFDSDEHKCKEAESLKKEMAKKMPWSIFALFVASMITIGGIYLNYDMNKTDKTLDIMIELKEKTSKIETKQEIIIDHFKSGKREKPDNFPFE